MAEENKTEKEDNQIPDPENQNQEANGNGNGKKKEKKKRNVSRVLEPLDCAQEHFAKAVGNLASGVQEASTTYEERRKASNKRKDGAIEDLVENAGAALSDGLKKGAPAIEDIAKAAAGGKRTKKRVRKAVKSAARLIPDPRNFPFGS